MGYSDSDTESSAQSSYLASAASSRIMFSSQSGADLKSPTSRIYKPREPPLIRNSLSKKSASVKQTVVPDAALASLRESLLRENRPEPDMYVDDQNDGDTNIVLKLNESAI